MGGPHTLDASVPWVQINASEKGAEMCSHMEKYGGVCATALTVTWYLNSAGNDDTSESENECPIQVHYPIAEHVARLLGNYAGCDCNNSVLENEKMQIRENSFIWS